MKLSDKKRQDILAAAEQLFYKQGAEYTSMDQIAKQANASKRTVYNHFETKEVLFQAILLNMFERVEAVNTISFSADMDLKQQLTAIAKQESDLLKSDNFLRMARVVFMQMLKQPELAKQLGNNKIGCMRFLESFLQEAVNNDSLKIDNIEFAAKQFVYQLKSFIFYPRLYGFEIPTPAQETQIIEEIIAMFLARYENRSAKV